MIKRARRIERVGGLSVLFYFDLSRYIPRCPTTIEWLGETGYQVDKTQLLGLTTLFLMMPFD